nr:hypothetical protein CFP56_30002 [Quercus suber]
MVVPYHSFDFINTFRSGHTSPDCPEFRGLGSWCSCNLSDMPWHPSSTYGHGWKSAHLDPASRLSRPRKIRRTSTFCILSDHLTLSHLPSSATMSLTVTMSVKEEVDANDSSSDDGIGIAPHQQPFTSVLRMPQQPTTTFRLANDPAPVPDGARFGDVTAAAAPVPIPHQNSISQPSHASPTGSGPMSSNVVIPPRPRPGRKPMQQEDAADRRRLQNRIAQRNFRDKRQQKLVETQQELDERRREYQNKINDLTRELEQARQDYARFRVSTSKQLELAEARAQAAEQRAQQIELQSKQEHAALTAQTQQATAEIASQPSMSINTTRRPVNYGPSVPTPPDDELNEIDFTHLYSRTNNKMNNLRPARNNESHGVNDMEIDSVNFRPEDSCGFCSDVTNCMCAEAEMEEKKQRQVIAPGNCEACRSDPQRARACRELAERSQVLPLPQLPPVPHARSGVPDESLPPLRISCSNFIDRTVKQGERLSSISELFGSSLHAVPSRNGQGYEIEEHEAAQALSKLSHSRKHPRAASRHDSNGGFLAAESGMENNL